MLSEPPDDVMGILRREQPRLEEDGYGVVCATGLALWRPVKPEEGDGGPEDDYRDGRCWTTVSVAAADYFDASGTGIPASDQA